MQCFKIRSNTKVSTSLSRYKIWINFSVPQTSLNRHLNTINHKPLSIKNAFQKIYCKRCLEKKLWEVNQGYAQCFMWLFSFCFSFFLGRQSCLVLLVAKSCLYSILKASKESWKRIIICKTQITDIYEWHILNQLNITKKLLFINRKTKKIDTVIDWRVSCQPCQNVLNDILIIEFSKFQRVKSTNLLKREQIGKCGSERRYWENSFVWNFCSPFKTDHIIQFLKKRAIFIFLGNRNQILNNSFNRFLDQIFDSNYCY